MSFIDFDVVRAEVAKQHNVLLHKDDPILVTLTMHDVVLGAFVRRVEEVLDEFERRGAAAMAQEVAVVKTAAEQLVGGATKYFADEVRKSAEHVQAKIAASIDTRIGAAERAAVNASSAGRGVYIAAVIAVAACLVTIGFTIAAFALRH